MINFSRRQLAKYTVDEISNNRPFASLSVRLAAVLILSGRQKEVDLLLDDIDRELEDRGILVRARVTTVHPLSEKLSHELTVQLKKLAGVEKVVLISQLDKGVLGGFKVETANHAWDKTIKRRLSDVREAV